MYIKRSFKKQLSLFSAFVIAISMLYIGINANLFLESSLVNKKTNEVKSVRSASSPHASVQTKKARTDYFRKQYLDPRTGRIPTGAGILDYKIAEQIDASAPISKVNFSIDWTEAGPNNVGGRTRAFAADISNPEIFITGAIAGGIWKSFDAGKNWIQVAKSTLLPSITSIAQDPREGFQNNWYAIGGEIDGSSSPTAFNSDSGTHYLTGLLHSTDGGNSWNFIEVGGSSFFANGPLAMASRVLVHPTTGEVFIATNGKGVLKATNVNGTWMATLQNQEGPKYSDIAVNKNGVMLQYLSANLEGGEQYAPGLYISVDQGASFSYLDLSAAVDFYFRDRGVLAFSESNPNVAYLLTEDFDGKLENGVDPVYLYRFTLNPSNGTYNFVDLTANLPNDLGTDTEIDEFGNLPFNSQGNYNISLAIHPANENTVFIGLTNLYRIRNINVQTDVSSKAAAKDVVIGGYGVDSFGYVDENGQETQHPDHHLMVFPDPINRPNYMVNANDGGLYATDDVSKTGLVNWSDLNQGYNVTQFFHISMPPRTNQNQFVAGAQDNGTSLVLVDHPQAAKSRLFDPSSGDGSFSYFGPDHMFVSSQNGVINAYEVLQNATIEDFNADGYSITSPNNYLGALANSSDLPGNGGRQFIHPYEVDRANHNTMYYPAGASDPSLGYQVFRNKEITGDYFVESDGPDSKWEPIPGFSSLASITALTTSTVPAGRLFLGASELDFDTNNYSNAFYVIENPDSDAPTVLTRAFLDQITGEPFIGNIRHIGVNPENADEILIALSNYNVKSLVYSADNGLTFTNVEGNLAGTEEATDGSFYGLSVRTAAIFPFNGEKMYLVGTSAGLYATTELNGTETVWSNVSEELIGNQPVTWLSTRISDGIIFAATHGRGVFMGKAATNTSIANASELPLQVSLKQNYPNPFNPSTTLAFSLSRATTARIDIFNSNGQLVSTLLNERLQAGQYQREFNAANLNSGVYFARLQAGDETVTKKMTLLK